MVAPVAYLIGAGLGVIGGYYYDRAFGDGNYTTEEMVIDAAGGAIGGSLAKPALRGAGQTLKFGVRSWFNRAIYSSRTEHAKDVVWAGSTLMRRNILTKPVIKGQVKGSVAAHAAGYAYNYFKSRGSSSESYQQNGGPPGTRHPGRPLPAYDFIRDLPKGTRTYPIPSDHRGLVSKSGKVLHDPCAKGWKLAKVGGRLRCIKLP